MTRAHSSRLWGDGCMQPSQQGEPGRHLQDAVGGQVLERNLVRVAEGERQHGGLLHLPEERLLDVPAHQGQMRPPAQQTLARSGLPCSSLFCMLKPLLRDSAEAAEHQERPARQLQLPSKAELAVQLPLSAE